METEDTKLGFDKHTVLIFLVILLILVNFVSTSLVIFFVYRQDNKILRLVEDAADGELSRFVNLVLPKEVEKQGKEDAKIRIVEFADFQCPFCGKFHEAVYVPLKTEYIDTGKAEFAFVNFAFLGEESSWAAEATLCAKDEGKYWEMHDKVFASQNGENEGAFSVDNLKRLAGEIGLNVDEFTKCLDSHVYRPIVTDQAAYAESLGVNSTPTVYINGYKYSGDNSFPSFKTELEKYE